MRLGFRFREFHFRGQDPVRGEAFHGEGAGDPEALGVLVRLVIEKFGVGPASDGSVNLLLALPPQIPPLGQEFFGRRRPVVFGFAGKLPFFPGLAQEPI